MASYAVLTGDTVINIIVAETKEIAQEVTGAECVECDNGSIKSGDFYDRVANVIVPAGFTYDLNLKKLVLIQETQTTIE